MIRRTFFTVNDPERGLGWMLKGAPAGFEPLDGLAVAHDTLEHFPGDTGSLADEAQAIGAALLIRVEGKYYDDMDGFGSDIADLYEKFRKRQMGLDLPVRNCGPLTDELEYTIRSLKKSTRDEIRHDEQHGDVAYDPLDIAAYLERFTAWMRVGYRRARRRFCRRFHDSLPAPWPWDIAGLFRQIESEVDNIPKEVEGQKLVVTVDVARVNVEINHDEYAYED